MPAPTASLTLLSAAACSDCLTHAALSGSLLRLPHSRCPQRQPAPTASPTLPSAAACSDCLTHAALKSGSLLRLPHPRCPQRQPASTDSPSLPSAAACSDCLSLGVSLSCFPKPLQFLPPIICTLPPIRIKSTINTNEQAIYPNE